MVTVRDEIRMLLAYESPPPEEMPMFAENRVHQRSSGNPYPNRVVLSVDRHPPTEKPFRIITIENQYIRLELMPELGGRIYSALDKRTGYDFFYKQHVIKPALIGMLGSWISGGCEFNWPCHHRPSTFMPVDVAVQHHGNGAVTVWMSEHEPLDRMKGMVGIHLEPDEARFDTRMKVYNRTPDRHSFLWWENAAVQVNPKYHLVFPPDVSYVQFHYRKNVTTYPIASGNYNGIRMGSGRDISLHGNTPQPTSYFCGETQYEFFGGYDESRQCGVIHVADRTVSVGKKMFTWAYNQLSKSWERALTDKDGAYAELMASSYSLNQPDFAWLSAYESREFSQMWYPVGATGVPLVACRELCVSVHDGYLWLQATVIIREAFLAVNGARMQLDITPDEIRRIPLEEELRTLTLTDANGDCLLNYHLPKKKQTMPATIPDNPTLDQLKTAEACYLMGVHCEQYRDPAVRPESYYEEALRRDPDHAGSLVAMARIALRQFKPEQALALASHAWRVVTVRNFHPESGELQYVMGRILEAMGRDREALEAYLQAAWAQDARSRALTRAAMTAGRLGRPREMIRHAEHALEYHAHNETASILCVLGYRRCGQVALGGQILEKILDYDPLNATARAIRFGPVPDYYESLSSEPAQTVLDCCEELLDAGETDLAAALLENLPGKTAMTVYVQAMIEDNPKRITDAAAFPIGGAYPSRQIEYRALRYALSKQEENAHALELLGILLYGSGNREAAEPCLEKAAKAEPLALNLRNLAVALYRHDEKRAQVLHLLDRALEEKRNDPQLVFEKAYLMLRLGMDPGKTACFLADSRQVRDDILIEQCRALNMNGQYKEVIDLMAAHRFTPCEGGEHAVAEQYMFAHFALGRLALEANNIRDAYDHFVAAQNLPDNLGAGLWNEVLLVPHICFEAVCLMKMEEREKAVERLRSILSIRKDYFTDMHLPELPCWQARALFMLKHNAEAEALLAAHARSVDAMERVRDAGFRKTTPFFISYMEAPEPLRQGQCAWQRSMIAWAAGDRQGAGEWAKRTLSYDPTNLYARLRVISGKEDEQ